MPLDLITGVVSRVLPHGAGVTCLCTLMWALHRPGWHCEGPPGERRLLDRALWHHGFAS